MYITYFINKKCEAYNNIKTIRCTPTQYLKVAKVNQGVSHAHNLLKRMQSFIEPNCFSLKLF